MKNIKIQPIDPLSLVQLQAIKGGGNDPIDPLSRAEPIDPLREAQPIDPLSSRPIDPLN